MHRASAITRPGATNLLEDVDDAQRGGLDAEHLAARRWIRDIGGQIVAFVDHPDAFGRAAHDVDRDADKRKRERLRRESCGLTERDLEPRRDDRNVAESAGAIAD